MPSTIPEQNATTGAFWPKTFGAIRDRIVEVVDAAHRDLAPAALALAHGELNDASSNRSRSAATRPGTERLSPPPPTPS